MGRENQRGAGKENEAGRGKIMRGIGYPRIEDNTC